MHLPNLVCLAGVVQHPFCASCLQDARMFTVVQKIYRVLQMEEQP